MTKIAGRSYDPRKGDLRLYSWSNAVRTANHLARVSGKRFSVRSDSVPHFSPPLWVVQEVGS